MGGPRMQPCLSVDAIGLYKLAVVTPSWTRAEAMKQLEVSAEKLDELTETLCNLQLFRRSVDPDREFDAVGPQAAVAELLADDEREIQRRLAEIATARDELLSLLPTYFEARQQRRRAEAVDVLSDVGMVRALLAEQSRHTKSELCIAHPGSGMSDDGLARSLGLDLLMLQREVEMRSVLQHSTRHHRPTQRYAAEVQRHGAQVRTVPIVPRRLIVFDREVAFIPLEGGDCSKGAVLVQEPSIVDHLVASFDLMWHNGRPFPVDEPDDVGEARDEVAQAILEQMAVGAKDELIARRLGLSLRTCRRHIATITADLGAQSRFQAGVLAQQRGLLE